MQQQHRFDLHPLSNQERLDDDKALQAAFLHLHRCGPATTGLAIAVLLDRFGVPTEALDVLLAWRTIDPNECHWSFDPHLSRWPAADVDA